MPTEIDQAKYVSFTSYKKDGSPVALPVWVVPFDGGYAFTTDRGSYKVRRIMRDPRATLRVCDIRGNVPEGAVTYSGTAVVLGSHESDQVSDLVRKKYRIGTLLLGVKAIVDKVRRSGSEPGNTAIKVTLDK